MSFTRAAERLHTVQPSLSQQIRRLEAIVGTELFLRQKHRLHLTEAGRIFLEESRKILQYTDRAITLARQAARAEAGLMTMGFVPGVEGNISRANSARLSSALSQGSIDATQPHKPPATRGSPQSRDQSRLPSTSYLRPGDYLRGNLESQNHCGRARQPPACQEKAYTGASGCSAIAGGGSRGCTGSARYNQGDCGKSWSYV